MAPARCSPFDAAPPLSTALLASCCAALQPISLSRGVGSGEQLVSLRVFGRLPDTDLRECTDAGVRKASREETAGEFAPTLVSVYVEFAAAA